MSQYFFYVNDLGTTQLLDCLPITIQGLGRQYPRTLAINAHETLDYFHNFMIKKEVFSFNGSCKIDPRSS